MFYTYFLLFFTYSICGWIMEMIFTFITEKKLINRGFLIGPYCPIYGYGSLLLCLLLQKYQGDIWVLFASTFFICSILEYLTSWMLEKIFKMRWWDYTDMKFNINGRICLETMLPFSIFGTLIVKYINPFFLKTINSIPNNIVIILAIIFFTILLIDTIISCNVIFKLKHITKNLRKDSTEEISKAVHKVIHNNIFMYDRIVKAFPKMTKIIKDKTKKTKEYLKKHKKSKK